MTTEFFPLKHGTRHCEDVSLQQLATAVGTPAYVYSQTMLESRCRELLQAFAGYPTLACFAVKASSNLSVLKLIFNAGLGADLVSGGELRRALAAGADPQKIVFSGVGKQVDEIKLALSAKILMFNVESPYEIDMIAGLARAQGCRAGISLRINPNIDAKTNEKISTGLYTTKFGLPEGELTQMLGRIRSDPHLELLGIGCHIGSQIIDLEPLRLSAIRMAELATKLRGLGYPLRFLDLGGGLGIRYRDENAPSFAAYAEALLPPVKATGLHLIIEPGRSLVGNAGVLLTRVINVKETPARHFVVVDAAMNDLLRPTLYGSYHSIDAVVPHAHEAPVVSCDFVGPVCETGDFLAKDRQHPLPANGDLFYISGCGAYAASMASQYNSRPRAPEVLVQNASYRLVRERETYDALWAQELIGLQPQGAKLST